MPEFKSAIEELEYWERRDAEREAVRKEHEKEIASTSVAQLTLDALRAAFNDGLPDLSIEAKQSADGAIQVSIEFTAPPEYKTL